MLSSKCAVSYNITLGFINKKQTDCFLKKKKQKKNKQTVK